MDKYSRHYMRAALESVNLHQSTIHDTLANASARLCIPRDHILQDHNYCSSHMRFLGVYCRHCNEKGRVVHLGASIGSFWLECKQIHRCDGECGATEEHELEYDFGEKGHLTFKPDETFASDGHSPFIAGYTNNGKPMYIVDYSYGKRLSFSLVLGNGFKAKGLRVQVHYTDGSSKILPPDPSSIFRVPVLRFDADVYTLLKVDPVRNGCRADATGPFYWKLHRKLSGLKFDADKDTSPKHGLNHIEPLREKLNRTQSDKQAQTGPRSVPLFKSTKREIAWAEPWIAQGMHLEPDNLDKVNGMVADTDVTEDEGSAEWYTADEQSVNSLSYKRRPFARRANNVYYFFLFYM